MSEFQRRQQGATLVTAALLLLFLIGMMGFAIDLGRLYIVKTEMQAATDACALAASYELDGQATSLDRARNVGLLVANKHKANLQTQALTFVASNVTFSADAVAYAETMNPAQAKYVRCQHNLTGLSSFLLPTLSAALGTNLNVNSVGAAAVASLTPAQTACSLPIQITAKDPTSATYGFTKGEWLVSQFQTNSSCKPTDTLPAGQLCICEVGTKPNGTPSYNDCYVFDSNVSSFKWANLDGTQGNSTTEAQLKNYGICEAKIGTELKTPGVKAASFQAWNTHFGLYHNSEPLPEVTSNGVTGALPDLTGHTYFHDGVDLNGFASITNPAINDYLAKRDATNPYPFQDSLSIPNSYNRITSAQHKTWGGNRRLVLAPIAKSVANPKIDDFACILMLHPILESGNNITVKIEFVGLAGDHDMNGVPDTNSPCSSAGAAGGAGNGPKVPALVQ